MPRLSDLHAMWRLGVALLVATLLGGYAVSGLHLSWHYDERDGREGLTLDDIRGHYHGVQAPSPLISSLESGHPESLTPDRRSALLDWLRAGGALSERYDDLDLGDRAPAEIIATDCLSCHSRSSTGIGKASGLPLEYWDDIQPLAYATDIRPTSPEILAMSQHTHAPTMALVLLVLALLGAMTRVPRWVVGCVVFIGAVGLAGDMSAWWLARSDDRWIYAIVGGGFCYAGATTVAGLIVIADCIVPRTRVRAT